MKLTTCLVFLLLTFRLSAQQTYFDGTFNDSDWLVTTLTTGNGGLVSAAQSGPDGNPGSYRQVNEAVNTESLVRGLHLNSQMIYSFQEGGALDSISYSLETRTMDNAEAGIGLVIKQGTNLFFGGYHIASGADWQGRSFANLRRDQFTPLTAGELDFSATAEPLQFGFMTANSQALGPGYEAIIHVDNFSVTAVPLPTLVIAVLDSQHTRVSWPTNAPGYTLEFTTTLPGAVWTPVNDPVTTRVDQFAVTVESTEPAKFFRLQRQ